MFAERVCFLNQAGDLFIQGEDAGMTVLMRNVRGGTTQRARARTRAYAQDAGALLRRIGLRLLREVCRENRRASARGAAAPRGAYWPIAT